VHLVVQLFNDGTRIWNCDLAETAGFPAHEAVPHVAGFFNDVDADFLG